MRPSSTTLLKLLFLVLLSGAAIRTTDSDAASTPPFLSRLAFHSLSTAGKDFGRRVHRPPAAILHPNSAADIASAVCHTFSLASRSDLTIAARGAGHSLNGQAQAAGGIVISMTSPLSEPVIKTLNHKPYAEVWAGELWINLLRKTLKHGLAPRSWTDYLHLTIGGTLSNAGLSGQAFRHGPQISNVKQLEVVTGRGELKTCSEEENSDLFHAVLGGLGQFGIITKAQIILEPAPKMVRWIRVLYEDFSAFTGDQEMLISLEKTFDYIEGFVMINRKGILNSWRTSLIAQDPVGSAKLEYDGKTLFCLEMAMNFDPINVELTNKGVEELLSRLRYLPSTLFQAEVPYIEFLDRVHTSEKKLRNLGLWEIPHPWLNLLVPSSRIGDFADHVFGGIVTDSNTGPILLYPVTKSKWDNRTSVVIPDEETFYLVGFLHSVSPSKGKEGLQRALDLNERILKFCAQANIKAKQYLPHYSNSLDWMEHFGEKWETLVRRKMAYDPMAILAPGQQIFKRGMVMSS